MDFEWFQNNHLPARKVSQVTTRLIIRWADETAKLEQICIGNLDKNFNGANAKKPDFAVVAGSLACLERISRVRRGCVAAHRPLLWDCTRKAIGSFTAADPAARIARYEVPAKALRFLGRHAGSLVDAATISSGALTLLLPHIKTCALSSATKVKPPGGDAYESCFAAMGQRLETTRRKGQVAASGDESSSSSDGEGPSGGGGSGNDTAVAALSRGRAQAKVCLLY